MVDPLFYPRRWAQQRAEDTSMQFNPIERQLNPDPDDCPGGCGWPAISCKCAELANVFPDAIAPTEYESDDKNEQAEAAQ